MSPAGESIVHGGCNSYSPTKRIGGHMKKLTAVVLVVAFAAIVGGCTCPMSKKAAPAAAAPAAAAPAAAAPATK